MIDDAEYLALLDGLKTAETLLDDFDAAGLLASIEIDPPVFELAGELAADLGAGPAAAETEQQRRELRRALDLAYMMIGINVIGSKTL